MEEEVCDVQARHDMRKSLRETLIGLGKEGVTVQGQICVQFVPMPTRKWSNGI